MTKSSTEQTSSETRAFDWPLADQAEGLLRRYLTASMKENQTARVLAVRMASESGTDFLEWVDHFVVSADEETALRAAGFV